MCPYFITSKDDPMTNKMVERITRSFESQSMMKTLGAMIHKVEKGNVIIEAPILPSTLQQQGYGHAGLTFSIGDSAAGYSALTLLPEDRVGSFNWADLIMKKIRNKGSAFFLFIFHSLASNIVFVSVKTSGNTFYKSTNSIFPS